MAADSWFYDGALSWKLGACCQRGGPPTEGSPPQVVGMQGCWQEGEAGGDLGGRIHRGVQAPKMDNPSFGC